MPNTPDEQLKPDNTPGGIYGTDGKPQFFDDPAMDRVVAVLMEITQTSWAQEERILALEEANGAEKVDREERLNEFINRTFAPLR